MTTYYVRKAGSDGNNGLSAGGAWLTIGHAEAAVTAGDTVYIGPGFYRELWVVATSGSAGSPITFIGDVTGEHTGDAPGFVVVSTYGDDQENTRAQCMTFEAVTFRIWKNIIYNGSKGATVSAYPVQAVNTGSASYEGCEFHRCSFLPSYANAFGRYGIILMYRDGVSPATTGILFRYCTIIGCVLAFNSQTSGMVDVKATFDRCFVYGHYGSVIFTYRMNSAQTPNYTIGGGTFRNCMFWTAVEYLLDLQYIKNTTNPFVLEDCTFLTAQSNIGNPAYTTSTPLVAIMRRCSFGNDIAIDGNNATFEFTHAMLGERIVVGMMDFGVKDLLERIGIYERPLSIVPANAIVGEYGTAGVGPYGRNTSVDAYGEIVGTPIPLGVYFRGTITDPNSKWSTTAYATDASFGSNAICASTGSATVNYLQIAGMESLGSMDLGTIHRVTARIYAHSYNVADTCAFEVATSGRAEILGTLAINPLPQAFAMSSCFWEMELSAPAGGWSKSVIENLQIRVWKPAGLWQTFLHAAMVNVYCGGFAPYSRGPVDYKPLPAYSTAQHNNGSGSVELQGRSSLDRSVATSIATYTISAYVRRNSDYSGAMPTLRLVDSLTGAVLATDTMAGAADTWEQLSIEHEFTSHANVLIRLNSYCDKQAGLCWFDDLEITKE